jgi:site-specific recombinase XerD
MASETVSLREARQAITETAVRELSPAGFARYTAVWRNFETFARVAFGVHMVDDVSSEMVRVFVDAYAGSRPAAPSTRRNRRSALRYLFRRLRIERIMDSDPSVDVVVDSRMSRSVRVLSDAEMDACRWAASSAIDAAPRYRAALALLEAGASTGEAGGVLWCHVRWSTGRPG